MRISFCRKAILSAATVFMAALPAFSQQVSSKVGDGDYTFVAGNFSTMCARGTYYAYSRDGKTYFTWAGRDMNPHVTVVDEKTGEIAKPVMVREYNYDTKYAYHDYPTLVASEDGTVHIFMAKHNRFMHYLRSPKGGDINGEWKETVFNETSGYPFPIITSDGTIFLFFNINKDPKYIRPERPLYFRYSKDGRDSWSDPIKCMDRDIDDVKEIYIGSAKWEPAQGKYPERINFVGTLAGVGGHNKCHKDIYYVYMDVKTMKMHTASGEDLGDVVSGEDEWRKITVLDTGESFSRPFVVQHTANVASDPKTGRPLVGYEYFFDPVKRKYGTTFTMWDGKKWTEPVRSPKGTRIGDMFVDGKGRMTAYVMDGGAIYGYVYNRNNTLTPLGKFAIPDMRLTAVSRVGGYDGYESAQFVIFEKYADIYRTDGAFKVGVYNGKMH